MTLAKKMAAVTILPVRCCHIPTGWYMAYSIVLAMTSFLRRRLCYTEAIVTPDAKAAIMTAFASERKVNMRASKYVDTTDLPGKNDIGCPYLSL